MFFFTSEQISAVENALTKQRQYDFSECHNVRMRSGLLVKFFQIIFSVKFISINKIHIILLKYTMIGFRKGARSEMLSRSSSAPFTYIVVLAVTIKCLSVQLTLQNNYRLLVSIFRISVSAVFTSHLTLQTNVNNPG